ncbi:MAG: NADH-quinone oxidoreductase subunit C [Candidatus Nanopelagicales bacterium]|jgi:NADH-quinone oxidoreductase subunit C|nr:NADH-quinone oxidoreductase subunit C [Candidatus Nanopelagicales bacterium]
MRCDELAVAATSWRATCAELAADGARMLDFLTCVDEPADARIEVLAHLVDVPGRRRVLVRTTVDRADPELDSVVDVLPGAAWHEREAHEMFGVRFTGNPDLRPLLTTGAMGHPLRRTTPLPSRVQTPWPGASDPAERPPEGPPVRPGGRVAARPRSRLAPPGVLPEWTPATEGPRGAEGTPGAEGST